MATEQRRRVASLGEEQLEALRRALIRTVDVDERTDLTPPPNPSGAKAEPRRGGLPANAPPRDRVFALYDACLDWLGVFLGAGASDPPERWPWDRAGRRVREAVILAPARRVPRHFGHPTR